MFSKANLNKRICDCEESSENTQTYREFIRDSENEFEIEPSDIDLMDEDELINYFNFMCELWDK